MSDNKRQQVATMMDQELFTDEQLKALLDDPASVDTWERYQLVRNLIKYDANLPYDPDLSSRISAAIANEPAFDKVHKQATIIPFVKKQVKQLSEQAAGFAVAASVTAMMLFGVQQLNPLGQNPAENQTATTVARTIEFPVNQVDNSKPRTPVQELLLDHARESSRYGLQNMLNYVDVVSHSVTIPLKPEVIEQLQQQAEQAKKAAEQELQEQNK